MRKSNYGIIEYNGEEYQGQHEPIISKEIYDIAMRCMLERKFVRANTSEHLLTGLLHCGKCGAKMRYQKWGNKGCKLVCYSQQKSKLYLVKDPDCNQERVWADEVEETVIQAIFAFANNYKPSETESLAPGDTVSMLYEQQSALNKKIKRLYNIYAAEEDNDILLETIDELKKKLSQINQQIEMNTKSDIVLARRKEKAELLLTVSELWDTMDVRQKKHIIRKLVNKVVITDSHVHIDFTL